MTLKEKTTEKLEQELKDLRRIITTLIGFQGVLCIVCIFELFKTKSTITVAALIIVPIALSALIPFNYNYFKKIKAELASRNNSELSS